MRFTSEHREFLSKLHSLQITMEALLFSENWFHMEMLTPVPMEIPYLQDILYFWL